MNYSSMILGFFLVLSFQVPDKIKHDVNNEHSSNRFNKSRLQIAFNSLISIISDSKICGKRWKFLCSNNVLLSFLKTVRIARKNQGAQLK